MQKTLKSNFSEFRSSTYVFTSFTNLLLNQTVQCSLYPRIYSSYQLMYLSGVGDCAFKLKASKRKKQLSAFLKPCLWAQIMTSIWHFAVEKTRLLLPVKRISCLYAKWFAYKRAICEENLCKNRVLVRKFLMYRMEIKGSKILLMLILSEKKFDSTRERYASFKLETRKCCFLLMKFAKHI